MERFIDESLISGSPELFFFSLSPLEHQARAGLLNVLPDGSILRAITEQARTALSTAAGLPELNLEPDSKTVESRADKGEAGVQDNVRLPKNAVRVPLTLQSTNYTCGASALQSVLKYYGDEVGEMDLARELKTTPADGTNYKEIKRYGEKNGYAVAVHINASLDDLKHVLGSGKPALVLIQAWAEPPVDYKNDWDDGHYVVACGYDSKNIYFMDPATSGNYTHIPIPEFMERWHDVDNQEKLSHFFMTVTKPKPAYDPASVPKISRSDTQEQRRHLC